MQSKRNWLIRYFSNVNFYIIFAKASAQRAYLHGYSGLATQNIVVMSTQPVVDAAAGRKVKKEIHLEQLFGFRFREYGLGLLCSLDDSVYYLN